MGHNTNIVPLIWILVPWRFFTLVYPNSFAAVSTRRMVSGEKDTLYFLFKIIDTADWETPALFATSVDVTFFRYIILPLRNRRTLFCLLLFLKPSQEERLVP